MADVSDFKVILLTILQLMLIKTAHLHIDKLVQALPIIQNISLT